MHKVSVPFPGVWSIDRQVFDSNRLSPLMFGRYIVKTEGTRGLFKGLGPNIIGVAPSRGLYFWVYTKTKKSLNQTQ